MHEVHGDSETIRSGNTTRRVSATTGAISLTLDGPTPKGEEDVLKACGMLRERLALVGEHWPGFRQVQVDEDETIDAVAERLDENGVTEKLEIQVTRPLASQAWRDLSTGLSHSASPRESARALIDAIQHKVSRYDPVRRSGVVLLLDATTAMNFVLAVVLDEFREQHEAAARQAGFRAVWIAGPTAALTFQLA